jgi:hypothetical protein
MIFAGLSKADEHAQAFADLFVLMLQRDEVKKHLIA